MTMRSPEKIREQAKLRQRVYRKKPGVLETGRERCRRWRSKYPEKVKEHNRRWRMNNPDKVRDMHFKREYGKTAAEVGALKAAQNHICSICQKPRELYVDHCHITKKFRGMLCNKCNLLLGHAEDSLDILESACEYLKRFSKSKNAKE